jgi:hypothetical protein
MYIWQPAEDTQYVYSASPTYTSGLFYDVLHVERSNEGWHGFLLIFSPPSFDEYGEHDAGGLTILDEELFETQEQAELWCTQRDTARYEKENPDERYAE